MLFFVELRPSDAIGVGGELLKQMGARTINSGGTLFEIKVAVDPALYDDYVSVLPIIDRLATAGVRPLYTELRHSGGRLGPLSASATSDLNSEIAGSLRRCVLSASDLTSEESQTLIQLAKSIEEGSV